MPPVKKKPTKTRKTPKRSVDLGSHGLVLDAAGERKPTKTSKTLKRSVIRAPLGLVGSDWGQEKPTKREKKLKWSVRRAPLGLIVRTALCCQVPPGSGRPAGINWLGLARHCLAHPGRQARPKPKTQHFAPFRGLKGVQLTYNIF